MRVVSDDDGLRWGLSQMTMVCNWLDINSYL